MMQNAALNHEQIKLEGRPDSHSDITEDFIVSRIIQDVFIKIL